MVALIAVLLTGAGYLYWIASGQNLELDAQTLCPESGPTGVAVVILDTTDELTPVQRADISNKLRGLRTDLPLGWRLAVYPLSEVVNDVPAPAIAICNPGRGENLSQLTANPRLVEARWKERFEQPVDQIVHDLSLRGEGAASPLMEQIQAIGVAELSGPEVTDLPRQLILVSDMLQHSEGFSMYREGGRDATDYEAFRERAAFTAVRTDLRGVEVTILYLRRSGTSHLQGRDHVAFWEQFFRDQGARVTGVQSVTGS